jgi:exodeoxyribonuclease VII small subunit
MEDDLRFEEALSRLEEIVALMESETTPLEKLVEFYEEGVKLSRFCQNVLAATENKIELLTNKLSDAKTEPEPDSDGGLPF